MHNNVDDLNHLTTEFPDNSKLKLINESKLKDLRKVLLELQGGFDAITGLTLKYEDSVVDHKHRMNKRQILGDNDGGLIRQILDFRINSFEGKVVNAYHRYGLSKMGTPLPDLLRKLADYLEAPTTNIIHPTEKPKALVIGKRQFNKLNKLYHTKYPKRKVLAYPHKGKIGKGVLEFLDEFKMRDEVINNQLKS
ncbi:MAG: hypothetical protein DRI86_14650 [Bacteroidetes bacterium]|nr:MAG: hypothetical protein DRI86_14650 [Bacteroidota bacterium]